MKLEDKKKDIMKRYVDKNNRVIEDEDFILLEGEKICQALRCEDGTLLYEELEYSFDNGKIELTNEPNYPDAYEHKEVEVISYNRAIKLLREF